MIRVYVFFYPQLLSNWNCQLLIRQITKSNSETFLKVENQSICSKKYCITHIKYKSLYNQSLPS